MAQASETGLGDCFEVAAKAVMGDPQRVLVHGIVEPLDGSAPPHWHAWVEYETTYEHPGLPGPLRIDHVIDRSNGNDAEMATALYYKLGQIDPARCQRYDQWETARMLVLHEHWGPWVDDEGKP